LYNQRQGVFEEIVEKDPRTPMLNSINKLRKSKGLSALTDYNLELSAINGCQKAVGLPKIKPKERPCLVCNRLFRSLSPPPPPGM
jgi:hypothetical protein